jgi:hypothetical protein
MNSPLSAILIFCFLILLSCKQDSNSPPKPDSVSEELQWSDMADLLLDRANLANGESVLLMGERGRFDPIYSELKKEILDAGSNFLGVYEIDGNEPEGWSSIYVEEMHEMTGEELRNHLRKVDLGIMMPGASPTHEPYAALQDILQEGSRRTIHFHWSGAYDINGNEVELTSAMDAFYQSVILETDYGALARKQNEFEAAMRQKTIRVTTPSGTDISFEIGDRPVTKQDGEASRERAIMGRNLIDREIEIPAGAIRVAPLEESVNGVIRFPDAQWDGHLVRGLKLTFTEGQVSGINADSGEEYVYEEIGKVESSAGRKFREFALGMNPLLVIQKDKAGQPWIPYYGYGEGIVRLSLGDNTELGGKVTGGYVRWNFFTDATVTVGDETWVREGVLVR